MVGSMPEVVVVACGGNNICDPSVSPLTVARELFSRFGDRGRVVVFCSVLYRRENGGSTGVIEFHMASRSMRLISYMIQVIA